MASLLLLTLPRSVIRIKMENWWRWWLSVIVMMIITRTGNSINALSIFGLDETPVSRIAFGSCSNQSHPQTIWDAVNNFSPQLFIWLGDNIYGDIKRPFKLFGEQRTFGPWKNAPRFIPASEHEMQSRYEKAKTNPGYSKLRKSSKIIGTWDDHDYGLNDAGKEFSSKVTNQRLLLDFLDEPLDSPRRKQDGVYTSYTFGPVGRQIKVILLDTRYHRDPMGSDGNILGNLQWKWLEKELYGPPTVLTLIGSSVQVLSNLSAVTSPLFRTEGWGRFPKERSRLFDLIRNCKRDGVIFLSGDVHFGEIAKFDCAVGYPLYDFTSSGLTQSVEGVVPRPFHHIVRLMAWLTPTTLRLMASNCRHKSCTYGRPNFGAIEIDWDKNPAMLKVELRDVNGSAVISVNISVSDLQAGNLSLPTKRSGSNVRYCTLETDRPWIVRHQLTIIFFSLLAGSTLVLLGLAYAIIRVCWKCTCKMKHD